MTDKADQINRMHLVAELARLCPDVPNAHIVADVNTLGSIGARLKRHEERMCSYEDYYNRHISADGETDKTAERLEARAAKIAAKYGATIKSGDPRGYVLHIHRAGLRGNTWGGDEHGYGLN